MDRKPGGEVKPESALPSLGQLPDSASSQHLDFSGRVALVTGAGRGMGAAYATLLASRGASVIVNDLGVNVAGTNIDDGTAADEMVEQIRRAGGEATADAGDVSKPGDVKRMVSRAHDVYGRLDIVIHNAGIARLKPFAEVTEEDVEAQLSVHLRGAIHLARHAWPQMTHQSYGRLVFISSSAVFGMADNLVYSVAKAGLIGLVASLSTVEPSADIKVNAVAPRASTRMTVPNLSSDPSRSVHLPSDRVAAVVAYLAHHECTINGELLGAGGGKVDRIALAATRGYAAETLSAEDVAANIEAIRNTARVWFPPDCLAHADSLWAGSRSPVKEY